jgi:hypothetical protein
MKIKRWCCRRKTSRRAMARHSRRGRTSICSAFVPTTNRTTSCLAVKAGLGNKRCSTSFDGNRNRFELRMRQEKSSCVSRSLERTSSLVFRLSYDGLRTLANGHFAALVDDDFRLMLAAFPTHVGDAATEQTISPGDAGRFVRATRGNAEASFDWAARARVDELQSDFDGRRWHATTWFAASRAGSSGCGGGHQAA